MEDITWADVHTWTLGYLNPHSAFAFAHWLWPEIEDWADEDLTLSQLLTGAWQEWIGHGYPNPNPTEE